MATVGILIETEDGVVKDANFGVLTAARGAGDNTLVALMLDGSAESAAEALRKYGANKVVQVSAAGGDLSASPDLKARVLAAAIEKYGLDALLGLASARGRDIFARLAAFMDLPLASDCISVDLAGKTAIKSHFSGKTFATIRMSAAVMLCTIRPNAIEAQEAPVDAAVENDSAAVDDPGLVKVVEVKKEDAGNVDLTEAAVIVTGGRPIASADNYKILEECARLLGGTIGASRAAVDAGFAPHSLQVGQTGKTVSPRLYIGCGLSGSVQHFAGMKTSKVIVAINTDKDAPIFEKCDYGIVGDLFEVVPVLTEVLKEKR
ncbi:electron transfer flavoprotein subunit alpha [Desulfosarcina widdelii]|uniref:Electron transfer flavoprotein subunit alpha n=1 Tax=Desulfosarcina widdelii TaxID=947919 RepID=A0A5K7ZD30_9BACT|nr:electron transfer flavoprotein subunit alpha/FixB family protein [Desulfosarcina widdelii]BBO78730.1 electron transfer flavoprotein subunit alpha [Desulfosarcina widdelii]